MDLYSVIDTIYDSIEAECTDDFGIYATQEVNGNVNLLRISAPFQSRWITFLVFA